MKMILTEKMNIAESTQFLQQNDAVLAPLIAQIELEEIASTGDVFHDLISCIIEQQIHFRSTKNIFKNLLSKAEIDRLTLENFEIFESRALSGIKISMKKMETVQAIVEFFEKTQIDWNELSSADVRAHLGQIQGVGPWSVDMILLYTLGRNGIFPAKDFHLKKMLDLLYPISDFGTEKKRNSVLQDLWMEHCSVAVLYLLEAKKLKIVRV